MSTITGIVQEIQTRKVSGGTKTAYNIVVAGESYGVGLYAPKCKVGDYVRFELDDNSRYKDVVRNTLQVSKSKPPAEAVAEAKATAGKAAASADNKQETISRQSALNSAIAFLAVGASVDALPLPKTDAKGKKQEALDALLAKYTQQFYEQSTGQKWSGTSPKATPTEDEAEAAPDDSAVQETADADNGWE